MSQRARAAAAKASSAPISRIVLRPLREPCRNIRIHRGLGTTRVWVANARGARLRCAAPHGDGFPAGRLTRRKDLSPTRNLRIAFLIVAVTAFCAQAGVATA